PRNDRFRDRDRDRGGRHDRHDRHGGDNRPRRDVFTNEREGAEAASPASAPIGGGEGGHAPLSPRRPLPATVEESDTRENPTPAATAENAMIEAADPMFGRDDSDIQHGRRNQPKKKPRFEVEEEEVKNPEETKA